MIQIGADMLNLATDALTPRQLEAQTGFEPVIVVLQTNAFPLGYCARFISYLHYNVCSS